MTNGMLFPEKWSKISNMAPMIREIQISIDAASKETYEKIRRGGKWERLRDSINYMQELKRRKELSFALQACFVVQASNYNEIPAFVDLSREWGFDSIKFQRIHISESIGPLKLKRVDVADGKNELYSQYKPIRDSNRNMPNTKWDPSL
jgi:molybdenum cofactor biosynthesis enzyme MoaA